MAVNYYAVRICDDCMALKGEMCHEPGCAFCRRTMEEVGEYLDAMLIRPIVDGERIDLSASVLVELDTSAGIGDDADANGS